MTLQELKMSKESQGWVSIHRTIWENPIFFSEPFNKALAWIDLVMLARHEKKPQLMYVRGNEVWVQYAEIARAESTLCERWKWSRTKLRKFLKTLEKELQIEIIKTPCINKIKIVNYAKHQEKIQQKDDRKTTEKLQKNLNNNVNNENNVNNDIIPRINSSNNIMRMNEFNSFWNLYPKKINKTYTSEMFDDVVNKKKATIDEILLGAEAYAEAAKEMDDQFLMSPDNWLRKSCWENKLEDYQGKSEQEKIYEQFLNGE